MKESLSDKYPDLVKEWHPIKNGALTPSDVSPNSGKKVWWYLPYDDPETGKHFDFEWEASICNRVRGRNCPYLSGRKVWLGYNDLATRMPQLVEEWHPTRNGKLKPTDVTMNSEKKVWWYLPYDDPETGKHFDFEWEAIIENRVKGIGCPYLSGRFAWSGYNDLKTKAPELALEWHPTKNGKLKPTDVTLNSGKKVWWLLPYDDPETGKHFDFEWEAIVANRVRGCDCPYLSGKAVWKGYNDLATRMPELAVEWHPTKNGELSPSDVTIYSNKKVWWYLPYDDPETGKSFDFEWESTVLNRSRGDGCPFLSGRLVWQGYNDLATRKPKLAAEWHPAKNGKLTPADVTISSNKKVWWWLPYDDPETGKHFDFEWEAVIESRVLGYGCPYLSSTEVWEGYNDLATRKPELAVEWHPTKNGGLSPSDVTIYSNKKVWWYLPYDDPETGKHFDFEWKAVVFSRMNGMGCPYLSGKAVWKGYNDLVTKMPELAAEWHPTKNGELTPSDITMNSGKKVWWYLPYDDPETGKHFDFEWKATVYNRVNGKGCPYLVGKAVWKGYNDLETKIPELAIEWHPAKNGRLTPGSVTTYSEKKAWWRCECGYEWRCRICERAKGATCRMCGK